MYNGKTAQELAEDIFYNFEHCDYKLTNKQIRRINKRLHRMVDGFTIVAEKRIWNLIGGPFFIEG